MKKSLYSSGMAQKKQACICFFQTAPYNGSMQAGCCGGRGEWLFMVRTVAASARAQQPLTFKTFVAKENARC